MDSSEERRDGRTGAGSTWCRNNEAIGILDPSPIIKARHAEVRAAHQLRLEEAQKNLDCADTTPGRRALKRQLRRVEREYAGELAAVERLREIGW